MWRERGWAFRAGLVFILAAVFVNVLLIGFNILFPLRVFGFHLLALFAINDTDALRIQADMFTDLDSLWQVSVNTALAVVLLVVFVPVGMVVSGPATALAAWLLRLSPAGSDYLMEDSGAANWAKMGPLNRELKSRGVPAWERVFRVWGLSAELWFFVLNFVFYSFRYWGMLAGTQYGSVGLGEMYWWAWPFFLVNGVTVCAVAAVTTGVFFAAIEALIKAAFTRVRVDVRKTYIDEVTLTFATLIILRGFGFGAWGMFFVTLNLALPFVLSKWANIEWRALTTGKAGQQPATALAQAGVGLGAIIILPWLLLWLAGGEVVGIPYARDVWNHPADDVEQVLLKYDRGPAPGRWQGVWDTDHGRLILCTDPHEVYYREGSDLSRHGKRRLTRGFHHLPGSEREWGTIDMRDYEPVGGRKGKRHAAGAVEMELAVDGLSFSGRFRPAEPDGGPWLPWHGKRVIPPDHDFGPPTANGHALEKGQAVKVKSAPDSDRLRDAVVVRETVFNGVDVSFDDGTEERFRDRNLMIIDSTDALPVALPPPNEQEWVMPTQGFTSNYQEGLYESDGKWYRCRINGRSDTEEGPRYEIQVGYHSALGKEMINYRAQPARVRIEH